MKKILLLHCFLIAITTTLLARPTELPESIIVDSIQNEEIQSRTFGVDLFLNKNFLMYFPKDYKESLEDFPMMLLLHGMGKRGTNINDVLKMTILENVKNGKDYPFIIMAPQCFRDDNDNTRKFTKDSNQKDLMTFMDEVIERYKVDTSRIYLSGTSGGGTATYHFLTLHPEKFAAAIPVCGNTGPYLIDSKLLASIPMWIFHGEADEKIGVENSINMYNAIKAAGGKNIFLTTYPGVGHDSWNQAYNEEELYPWMLSHSLADTVTSSGTGLLHQKELPFFIKKNSVEIRQQPNTLTAYSLSGEIILNENNVSFKSLDFKDHIVILQIKTGNQVYCIKHISQNDL